MFSHRGLDDDVIEELLAGRGRGAADLTLLVDFAEDVRAATRGPAPAVSPGLAAMMAGGLETDHSDVQAGASAVARPEAQAAEPPKRQPRKVATAITLTGLRRRAKVALGVGVAA